MKTHFRTAHLGQKVERYLKPNDSIDIPKNKVETFDSKSNLKSEKSPIKLKNLAKPDESKLKSVHYNWNKKKINEKNDLNPESKKTKVEHGGITVEKNKVRTVEGMS